MSHSTALVWLRFDLRLHDHPILYKACHDHERVIVLYIYDEHTEPMGAASQWWLHETLKKLSQSIKEKGGQLVIQKGHPLALLDQMVHTHQVDHIYWHRLYDRDSIERDGDIKKHFKDKGIHVTSLSGSLLFEPWEVKNKSGQPFKVFSPFWKACLRDHSVRPCVPDVEKIPSVPHVESMNLNDLSLKPKISWDKGLENAWEPGEDSAKKRFDWFLENCLEQYKTERDFVDKDATSKLSPHLRFGEISPVYMYHETRSFMGDKKELKKGGEHFLSEMGWREFSYHLLYQFPHIKTEPIREEFKKFPWILNEKNLKAWQEGKTGYPIVDAAMRQLWHTGWMHNRARMIVASFLIKDLMIHWHEGEAWFWDTLIDADPANNRASWQWVAGCGADAAPYFRIFNPILQSKRFDPEGNYIKKWIPELKDLSPSYIHEPWTYPGCDTLNYPKPLVDHAKARDEALKAYEKIKKNGD